MELESSSMMKAVGYKLAAGFVAVPRVQRSRAEAVTLAYYGLG